MRHVSTLYRCCILPVVKNIVYRYIRKMPRRTTMMINGGADDAAEGVPCTWYCYIGEKVFGK